MAEKKPWFKFYPADWRGDEQLRIVSLAARGLWIEMLCIMHKAEPYGHLVVNGQPVTDAQLAALAGTDLSTAQQLITELETAGVFSRSRTRTIYSRRMTRDEKRRKDGVNSAETGAIPGSRRHKQTVEKQRKNKPPPGVAVGVDEQPPPSPEARGQNPPCGPPKGTRITNPDDLRAADFTAGPGVDIGRELDKFRDWTRSKGRRHKDAPAAFRNWLRRAEDSTGKVNGSAEFDWMRSPADWPDDQWRAALKAFGRTGTWPPLWGPEKGHPGCLAPARILAEFEGQPA